MANSAGAPKIASLRTIKSDVVVGLGEQGDELAEKLDKEEPGWKISGKYVSLAPGSTQHVCSFTFRPLSCFRRDVLERRFASPRPIGCTIALSRLGRLPGRRLSCKSSRL